MQFDHLEEKLGILVRNPEKMTEFEVCFESGDTKEIPLSAGVSVRLVVHREKASTSYDVSICVFNREALFERLAWAGTQLQDKNELRQYPILNCVLGFGAHPFLVVLGLREVIFISHKQQKISSILDLNRREDDDRGFYFFNVLPGEKNFVVIYEGGVFKVTTDGTVEWERNLWWDDVFLHSDQENLYFFSEFRKPSNWAISVETGEVSQPERRIND